MTLGDGIRRNIADVEPSERALFRDAIIELNRRLFPGSRTDAPPGGVSWWFKQDEIHQATHVHSFAPGDNPEFVPWHREFVNRFEAMLRDVNPQLSLHYWDWTQDPRNIPSANLGGGTTGTLMPRLSVDVVVVLTGDVYQLGGDSWRPVWLQRG